MGGEGLAPPLCLAPLASSVGCNTSLFPLFFPYPKFVPLELLSLAKISVTLCVSIGVTQVDKPIVTLSVGVTQVDKPIVTLCVSIGVTQVDKPIVTLCVSIGVTQVDKPIVTLCVSIGVTQVDKPSDTVCIHWCDPG